MNIFKLPVCPYCNTIYRYGDVNKLTLKKSSECYNCKKSFRISRAGIAVLFAIVFLVAFLTDIFELVFMPDIRLLSVFLTNIIAVMIGIFLVPYFIGFNKAEKKK